MKVDLLHAITSLLVSPSFRAALISYNSCGALSHRLEGYRYSREELRR